MRLAIFGGTFDPIHKAHVAMARVAADQFQLDRVLFIPASNPPHKSPSTYAPYEDRLRMAEAACAGEPRFVVSRLEEGPGRSYSFDTIERVKATLSAPDELFFLIGADAFAEMESWHRWREVVAAVRFIVVSRRAPRPHLPAAQPAHSFLKLRKSDRGTHSALIPAALMIGHHLSASARWKAASASGVSCSRG